MGMIIPKKVIILLPYVPKIENVYYQILHLVGASIARPIRLLFLIH